MGNVVIDGFSNNKKVSSHAAMLYHCKLENHMCRYAMETEIFSWPLLTSSILQVWFEKLPEQHQVRLSTIADKMATMYL